MVVYCSNLTISHFHATIPTARVCWLDCDRFLLYGCGNGEVLADLLTRDATKGAQKSLKWLTNC